MNTHFEDPWSIVTPADLFSAVRRRLFSVIVTTVLVSAVVVAALLVWPNRYGSAGLMYVRLGRSAVSMDPTTKTPGSISLQDSRKAEVISIGSMITSREIAERTVRKIGVEEINAPRGWLGKTVASVQSLLPASTKTAGELTAAEYSDQLSVEEAIRKVQSSLDINITKDGYTLAVSSRFGDPFVAQAITRSVMDEYGRYHVEAHRSVGSLEFFEEQVDQSRAEAVSARQALQEEKNEMGWLSTESAETSLRDRIVALETSLDQAKSQLAEAESQTAEFARSLQRVEERVPVDVTSVASSSGDMMRSKLYDLQVAESDELAKISPSHPRYRILKEKMALSRKLVSDEGDEREEKRESLNPVHQSLQTQYQSTVARAAGLRSRCESLEKSLTETHGELRRLNKDVITLDRLTWHADIAEANYRRHAASLEDARIHSELNSQHMTDVSVIQEASLNLKKVSPPRGLLAVVGVLMGLCLGCLQAIVRETPDPRRSRDARGRFGTSRPESFASADSDFDSEQADSEVSRRREPAVAIRSGEEPVGDSIGDHGRDLVESLAPDASVGISDRDVDHVSSSFPR